MTDYEICDRERPTFRTYIVLDVDYLLPEIGNCRRWRKKIILCERAETHTENGPLIILKQAVVCLAVVSFRRKAAAEKQHHFKLISRNKIYV